MRSILKTSALIVQSCLVNRIKSAHEPAVPGQSGWKQTFKYDRYGNRNFDTSNASNNPALDPNCVAVCNPTVDPANNKLVGYVYDSAGNTKTDAVGRTFTYDAENKQVKVMNGTTLLGEYFYDGDGKRVKKVAGEEITIFVYDAGGKMVAEYSTIVASPTDAKVSYLTSDHLGSPRINTDANGATISRHDYMPFGEEVSRGYAGDGVRKQFTSYERDVESGLDYAKARMFGYNHGRFTSPDPLLSSGRIENPQTWNRYAYVLNNPLLYIDPLGLYEWADSAGGSATDDELLERSKDKTLKKNARNMAKRQHGFRQKFKAGLERAKTAATSNKLTAGQQQQVQESVDSYGNENEDNGVSVGIRVNARGEPITSGPKATVLLNADDTISADFRLGGSADQLTATIAHEGRHVADAQGWVNAGHPTGGDTDMNHYFREQRAWNVGSYVGQGLNLKEVSAGSDKSGKSYKVWSRGWKAAEIETKRANGVNNILTYSNQKPTDTDTYSNEHKHRP